MKTPPSFRPKKRYIAFRIHAPAPVPYPALQEAVTESLLEFLGERDFAKATPRLLRQLCSGTRGVLVTTPPFVDACKVALALVHQIQDQPVLLETRRVSGTIASLKGALRG
ncbi:MAG: hypothetical protein HY520_00705 [Candidatus Aenigmarchaeota archaeon]|nr:hypothetical protein [Candidatus Aenigmarchaeota archaeon]